RLPAVRARPPVWGGRGRDQQRATGGGGAGRGQPQRRRERACGPGSRPAAPAAGPAGEVVPMRARVGDRLIVGEDRIGEVLGVPSADGSPPYIIKWLKDGHIAMVLPDEYSRIVPAGAAVVTGAPEAAVCRPPGRRPASLRRGLLPGPTRC